jgi:prepilin-type processing-associated H-X9-DG protein
VIVEGDQLEPHAVEDSGTVGFSAFLDGIQRSHVVDYAGTVPIVGGEIAAVIRTRVSRRMITWADGHVAESRLYAPLQLLPSQTRSDFDDAGIELRDTLSPNEETSGHPLELLRSAVDAVKRDRERLEQELAEAWVSRMAVPLFVDGVLPAGPTASQSPYCVGVVKSHHTIYTPDAGLQVVLALAENARSSVFLIERAWGPRVLSWYLRLREPPSHDPFMGLVRVEIARTAELEASPDVLARRADEVSTWVLAERAPLALPDARWDRMVYGIRDCEEYLRATAG